MSYFDQNKFYQKLAKCWFPISVKEVELRKNRSPQALSEAERFIVKLMESILRLFNHLESLTLPLEYIRVESLPKKFEEPAMRDNYYNYHYENHVIRICSIFDYCLLLVNFIYRLGNPAKRVNFLLIIENENVSEQTKKALKNLSRKIERIKSERNQMIHEGNLVNEIVQEIIDNNLHWDLTSIPTKKLDVDFFADRKQNNIAELAKQMEDHLNVLNTEVGNVLDSLIDELEKTTSKLV